jgi:hypothetical protein
MQKGVLLFFLLIANHLSAQYFQDFEGWGYQSQGDWTVTDATGTYTTGGTYLNFGFSVSGYLKLGFNTTGDYMEFPPIPNPGEISFMARLSSHGGATLLVQILDNGSWTTTDEIPITQPTFLQYKVVVSSDNGPSSLPFRLVLKEFFGQSIFFDDFTANQSTLLPVTFSDFSTAATSLGIYVNWTTARETNSDYFTLQRTVDLKQDFVDIALIEGQKHSDNFVDYQFLDHSPNPGKNYYRLKQVDIGGAVHYSDVIETHFYPNNQKFLVFPTISRDQITVLTQNQYPDASQMYIIDQSGRRWLHQTLAPGNQKAILNIDHLPNGRYYVQWVNSSSSAVKTFFKS